MAVEMKFVLLFALLAYTKFSLGNTPGAGQSQKVCATPYKPVNINVYGKEGVKGEKGEIGRKGQKGDSGKNCKCNLQNPNKPSAHIEATNRRTVTYRANTVIKDWFVSAPNSHLAGGMRYHDGKLTVPTPGRYYIYTQLYYRSSAGRVYVRVNNNIITQIQPQYLGTGEGSLYAGGVFYLKAGDVISLYAQYSISIYMSSAAHSYFGAFLI